MIEGQREQRGGGGRMRRGEEEDGEGYGKGEWMCRGGRGRCRLCRVEVKG